MKVWWLERWPVGSSAYLQRRESVVVCQRGWHREEVSVVHGLLVYHESSDVLEADFLLLYGLNQEVENLKERCQP
jgi:hypothetical protein